MKQQLILATALTISSLASSVADVSEVDNASNSVIAAETDSSSNGVLVESDSRYLDSSSSSITEPLNNDNTATANTNVINDNNNNPFANLNNNNPLPTRNLSTKFEERKKKRAEKIAARKGGTITADGSVIAEAKSWKAPQNNGWQQPPVNSWQQPPPPPPSWNDHGHWEQPKTWEAPPRSSGWDEWSSRDWYKPPPTWENPTWADMPSGKSGKSNSLGTRVGGGYSGKSGKSGGIEQGWHESGKGWHSSSDNWETPNDWWSPSYFMSPFSCGNMCIDAFDAAMIQRDDHKLSTAVVECNTEYLTQQWMLHQSHDLVQVESYEYKGKCIAIHHDTDMDRSDIEEACNKGTLELTSCDHPASRWYFTGGQLLSFFCWSKGFSTNMAVVYNVTESQCDDELISTNEISGVTGNKPNTPKFCGQNSEERPVARNAQCEVCEKDSDCSDASDTCLLIPDCIVEKNGYCGTSPGNAITNCQGDNSRNFQCRIDADCPDDTQECYAPYELDGECPTHDFDVEYGDIFMFIEEKEMKMLYGDHHPSPSWTSPAWPTWSKPHDVPTRRRTAIPTKPGGGTGR